MSNTGMRVRERITLSSDVANVPVARRFIADTVVPCDLDAILVGDLELITSELVTNAVQHGAGRPVDIVVDFDGDRVLLEVTSTESATEVVPGSDWEVADVTSITGRGLGIVRALADDIEVRRRRRNDVTISVVRRVASVQSDDVSR